jgi:hypothetical protein
MTKRTELSTWEEWGCSSTGKLSDKKFIKNGWSKAVYLEVVAEILGFAAFSLSEFAPFAASHYYTITSKIVKKRGKRVKCSK